MPDVLTETSAALGFSIVIVGIATVTGLFASRLIVWLVGLFGGER